MALDIVTGDLVFGWYDGRNDPTYQSMEYFGAVLNHKKLDKMVEKIPLSNPLFNLGPATTPLPPNVEALKDPKVKKLVVSGTRAIKAKREGEINRNR